MDFDQQITVDQLRSEAQINTRLHLHLSARVGLDLVVHTHHLLNGHECLPWKGSIAATARLRSQRGAEAYRTSSAVRWEGTFVTR
jgi:hypothetical protein